jgi:hypothetical protein
LLQQYDDLNALKKIQTYSISTLNIIYSISLLLIKNHQKTSISEELKLLLNILEKTLPAKKKEKKDLLKTKYFKTVSLMPLIPSYLHLIEDFPTIYLHFHNLLYSIDSQHNYTQFSISDLITFSIQVHQQFGINIKRIFTCITEKTQYQLD